MYTMTMKVEERSNFSMFFMTIIQELKHCYWVINKYDSYYYPLQEEVDEEDVLAPADIIACYEEYLLISDVSMRKISSYIKDDGNTLICFEGDKSEFNKVVDTENKCNINPQKHPEELKLLNTNLENAEIKAYIYNDDALKWCMICNDYQYVKLLEHNLRKINLDYVENIGPQKVDLFMVEKYEVINPIDSIYKVNILNVQKSSFYSIYHPVVNLLEDCYWVTHKDNFNPFSIAKKVTLTYKT